MSTSTSFRELSAPVVLEDASSTPSTTSSKGKETNVLISDGEAIGGEEPEIKHERANRNITIGKGSFFRWFDPNDGPLERRLITKLDIYILTFACAAYIVGSPNGADTN